MECVPFVFSCWDSRVNRRDDTVEYPDDALFKCGVIDNLFIDGSGEVAKSEKNDGGHEFDVRNP